MSGSHPIRRRTLSQWADNPLLQTPAPSSVRRSAHDLSGDQPTAPPSPTVVARSLAALEQGQTHYVDVPGIAPLREKLAEYLSGMGMAASKVANILVTAGIQESRFLTIQKIGQSFPAIGVPGVVHPGVRKALGVRTLNVVDVPVERAGGFLPTLDDLRQVLEAGCRLLYLESPSRLSGAVYSPEQVDRMAQMVSESGAFVIWDQGLGPWVDGYVLLGARPEMTERVAVIGEAWPGAGLESWSLGYISAPEEWLQPMISQKQIMAICTSTAAQYAALQLSGEYPDCHGPQMQALAAIRGRALVLAAQLAIPVVPGAALSFVALRPADPGVVAGGLRSAGYQFADGGNFGAPGILRLAVTADGAVEDALNHL